MKMNGKIIAGPTPEVIVIPKGETEYIFQAMPVLNYDEFDKICPVPTPPQIVKRGGEKVNDYEDKDYNTNLTTWAQNKNSWLILTSLQATEGLEWDTVNMAEPDTWKNYEAELKVNFTEIEISLIMDKVHDACGLNQTKIDEATKRFLAGREEVPSS